METQIRDHLTILSPFDSGSGPLKYISRTGAGPRTTTLESTPLCHSLYSIGAVKGGEQEQVAAAPSSILKVGHTFESGVMPHFYEYCPSIFKNSPLSLFGKH